MVILLRIGFSEIDITPSPGFPLGGYLERYLNENKATGTLNDIFADVTYFDEDDGLIIISLETIAVEDKFYERIYRLVRKHGVRYLILAATHTHSAPETILNFPFFKRFALKYKSKIEEYLNFLEDKIKLAVEDAVNNVRDEEIYMGRAKVIGACSSRINPEMGKEGIATVLRFGKRVILQYACHPTVLSAKNMMYSGDFFSYTRDAIKKVISNALILNGAAGDLSTRFVRREQTPKEAERIGKIVAMGVIEAIKNSKEIKGEISMGSIKLSLVRRDLEKENLEEKLRKKIETAEEELRREHDPGRRRKLENEIFVGKFLLEHIREFSKELKRLPSILEIESIFFRLEELGFVSLPFELYSSLGKIIYDNAKALVIGYANDYFGYAPTKDAYEELDYEAMASIISAGEAERMAERIAKEMREI